MRKVRDFDAELKALAEKQRSLKAKRVQQLGELVLATGAEALTVEQLAGALLEAVEAKSERKEAWRRHGAEFFRKRTEAGRGTARRNGGDAGEPQSGGLFPQSPATETRP
jgi:hypothetical protein